MSIITTDSTSVARVSQNRHYSVSFWEISWKDGHFFSSNAIQAYKQKKKMIKIE